MIGAMKQYIVAYSRTIKYK